MKQLTLFLSGVLAVLSSSGQIEITLRKTFVDSLKNHISINAEYFVVKAHPHPNSGAKDGDLHIAGYDNEVGLATVAEIMNAKAEPSVVSIIHSNEGKNHPVTLSGAWRFWCEHPGSEGSFRQGDQSAIDNITNTNPDHAFEIHPILSVEGHSLSESLKRIEGFSYKNATNAFNAYSNLRCKLKEKGDNILIETNGIGFNYVDFWIEIIDTSQFVVEDGRFIMCKVLDANGEEIVSKMRMAFPLNSPAEKEVRTKHQGSKMHVAGIPRISLALVSYRIAHANDFEDILDWNLPVEMIIVSSLSQSHH
jgi:hypothetical protein